MHPVDSCHAVPLKSSLNVKIVCFHGKTSHPSRLSSSASFQSMLATPSLVYSELSCSCHSFCVLGPTFIPVDHSTASLLLEMAMDYSHERQEVRWVKYRPRCWIRVCGLGWGLDWLSSWQVAWGPKYSRTNAKGQGGSMGGNKWLMGWLAQLNWIAELQVRWETISKNKDGTTIKERSMTSAFIFHICTDPHPDQQVQTVKMMQVVKADLLVMWQAGWTYTKGYTGWHKILDIISYYSLIIINFIWILCYLGLCISN